MRWVAFLVGILLPVTLFAGGQQRVVLDVQNMTCAVCPITVKKALGRVTGVAQVSVDYEARTATVTFDPEKVTTADLVGATTNAGYPSSVRE